VTERPHRVAVERGHGRQVDRKVELVPLALEAMMTEHEADRTTSVMMDAAEARASVATGDMLARLVEVLRGLRLDPERMRANLDLGGGLIMAEAVMLDLGQAIGRQHAHDVVYDAAMAAAVEHKSFADLLAADPRVLSRALFERGHSQLVATHPGIARLLERLPRSENGAGNGHETAAPPAPAPGVAPPAFRDRDG